MIDDVLFNFTDEHVQNFGSLRVRESQGICIHNVEDTNPHCMTRIRFFNHIVPSRGKNFPYQSTIFRAGKDQVLGVLRVRLSF
jgi:CRISPR/Cas system type I-B associated protein Csh2 (Cas7 group RAMP superfamily)